MLRGTANNISESGDSGAMRTSGRACRNRSCGELLLRAELGALDTCHENLAMGAGWAVNRARARQIHKIARNAMSRSLLVGKTATAATGRAVRVVVANDGATAIADTLLARRARGAGDGLPTIVGPGSAAPATRRASRLWHTAGPASADLIAAAGATRSAAAITAAGAAIAVGRAARRRGWGWSSGWRRW